MFRLVGIPIRGAKPVVHDGAEFFYFLRRFFFPAHVACLSDPSVECRPHFSKGFNVLRAGGIDEVVQFVGIGLGVIKLLTAELGEERL